VGVVVRVVVVVVEMVFRMEQVEAELVSGQIVQVHHIIIMVVEVVQEAILKSLFFLLIHRLMYIQ
jgi:hypothetical protein